MINLGDKRLWGNEAADDEDPDILNSYFVTQPTFNQFFDPSTRLSIARARKGMGKSALLRECAYRVRDEEKTVIVQVKGADLVAQKSSTPTYADEYIYDWQQRICMLINRHLGVEIGFALNDDEMILVEAAELAGYKRRNLVGALVDRLKGKLGPVELQKIEVADNRALLKRAVTDGDWTIWLLIDDIDATFISTPEQILRLSTFFSACRDLATSYKGIIVRSCVRTDVWASIRKRDEALDKVEQYIFDIKWSYRETGLILAERIKSYVQRRGLTSPAIRSIEKHWPYMSSESSLMSARSTISLVFPEYYPWGVSTTDPHRVIHLYSAGRPRWSAQLCRMAGEEATSVKDRLIKFGHIKQVLEPYGRFRLDDIAREYRHQCEELPLIANAFSRQSIYYTTTELLGFIRDNILKHIEVTIDGLKVSDELVIARFLFQIGFLAGRRRIDGGKYYYFEEKPDLFISNANLDDGFTWFVYPSFHAALNLKNWSPS